MPTDEIRLAALEDCITCYPPSLQAAAREELRRVLEVLRAAEAWAEVDTMDMQETVALANNLVAALAALRSVR